MTARSIRSTFSVHVADYIEKGYSCSEALHIVVGSIRDGSGPRTTDVLLDLEEMGVWKPEAKEDEPGHDAPAPGM